MNKVNLSLVKKLLAELESSLNAADALAEVKTKDSTPEYVVEMSKATGLASGVMQEASMLVMDIQAVLRHNTMPAAKEDDASLTKLLGVLKGAGSGNVN